MRYHVEAKAIHMTDRPPRPKRSSVFIDAAMDSQQPSASMQTVRIRDLSEGGAKIEGKAPPVGTTVLLSRGGIEIGARVAWVSDRYFGVAFDEPVAVEQLMRAVAKPGTPERPVYAAALTDGVGRSHPDLLRRRATPLDRAVFGLRVAPRS
jgi:hypothetical protein